MEIDRLFGLPAGAGEKLEEQVSESEQVEAHAA
jgi:hypothetical protein